MSHRTQVLVAVDKFRGHFSAEEAAEGIIRGVRAVQPAVTIARRPLLDGGEGTAAWLTEKAGGHWLTCRGLRGPWDHPVTGCYGLSPDGATAYLDTASCIGWDTVAGTPRAHQAGKAHSFALGQIIREALDQGAQHLVIGLGGSVTTDGGAGMAQALGYELLDLDGLPISPGGVGLNQLFEITNRYADPRLSSVSCTVLCDVDIPLLGSLGTVARYAAQKGADQRTRRMLESGLIRLHQRLRQTTGQDGQHLSGAGAAGGLGLGCAFFLNGQLESGSRFMAAQTDLEAAVSQADRVITGEGRLDDGSFHGKAVGHLIETANRYHKPVYAVVGAASQKLIQHPDKHGLADIRLTMDYPRSADPLQSAAYDLAHRFLQEPHLASI